MEITTIEELQKHVGEFLVFEYKCPYAPSKSYSWIQKLLKILTEDEENQLGFGTQSNEIFQLPCLGQYPMELYPTIKRYSSTPQPYYTNAQTSIRTPTKLEMKRYKNAWRKYLYLGMK